MRTRGPTDYRNTRTTASSRNIDRGQRRQYRQSLA